MRYEYAYDCMNRLVRKTASGKMLLENRYDLNGNRIGRKDISGKETVYEYDHLDRMSKVVDNGHESVIALGSYDWTIPGTYIGVRHNKVHFMDYLGLFYKVYTIFRVPDPTVVHDFLV